MQSIYITNNFSDSLDFKTLSKYLNKDIIKKQNTTIVSFSSNQNNSLYLKNENFVSNLGVIFYKKKFNLEANELILNELQSGKSIEDILLSEEISGQFVLIVFFKNNLYLCTDKLGYYPLYIYNKNNIISISNTFLLLARNNKSTLNYLGISQYLSENYRHITYACCNENITNEIKYAKPATIYNIKEDKLEKKKYYNLKNNLEFGKYSNFKQIVELGTELLKSNISKLSNLNIRSDITGGVDTRLIVGLLKKLNLNFKVGTQVITEYEDFSNQGKYSEYKIIKQITDLYKLNLNVTTDKDYNLDPNLIDEITLLHSNKQTYNRRTAYFYNSLNDGSTIHLSGMSGTELMRLSYYDYFKSNEKLDLSKFLRMFVEQVDIMNDSLVSRQDYYENLTNFYENNLSEIKYDKAEDLSSYIDYFAFYRTHFCRYLSLANSFMPFYTPYGDFNFATMMYQTSYQQKKKFKIQRQILKNIDPDLAKINSTRGIPLTIVDLKNFYRFKNLISVNVPQQYFSLVEQNKVKIYKKLISLSFNNKFIYDLFKKNIEDKNKSKKNLWNLSNDFSIIEDLDKYLKKDSKIFEIIDKKKLQKKVEEDCNYNVLNRVINLEKIINYINI